jgi:hypothetical protein
VVSNVIPFLLNNPNKTKQMGNFKNKSVQTQIEQKVTKVNNSINVCKGGTANELIKKIETYFLRIDEDTKIILELDELDISIEDDEQTHREIYLKEYYDINDDKERISTMLFIEKELNYVYMELRKLQKQLEQFFPKRISWEEDENENGEVRGDEEVVLNKFVYDDDIDLDLLSENKASDNELILYNYYKVNESLSIEIIISYTELLEYFDSSFNKNINQIIESIIKSKM